jgi:hypothetical protein
MISLRRSNSDPNRAEAYFNRTAAWSAKGDEASALADYNKSVKINSRYAHPIDSRL